MNDHNQHKQAVRRTGSSPGFPARLNRGRGTSPRKGSDRPSPSSRACGHALLIHGHSTLTERFTAEAVAGLEAAPTQLHSQVLDGIRDGSNLLGQLSQSSKAEVLARRRWGSPGQLQEWPLSDGRQQALRWAPRTRGEAAI